MSVPPSSTKLTMSQRVDFVARLRAARALVLRDGESFREASTVLEHIGQVIGGKMGNGLKDHEAAIVSLAKQADQQDEESVCRLFNVVREARNKAVHDGAYARHLNGRLVDLLLVLEEAIMTNMDRVEDLMVRTPVAAEATPTRDGAADVAKDIIAIANFGGGYLVFGIAEKGKGVFQQVGLDAEQLKQLEVTTLNKAVREYIEPPHAVKCHRVNKNGVVFVVIEIPPSREAPLLAKKQNDTANLYPGRIYTRSTACESAEVRDNQELRRILERITAGSARNMR